MVSVMLYPCILCVHGYVCLVCCVFVNCLVKQFAICFGVVVILLSNVMEVFSVGGGAPLDRPCTVSIECACCACDLSVHLSAPSIGCVRMSEVISSFKSFRA